MTVKYANAYTEVYKILKCLKEEEYEKIPEEFIQVIEENRNLDYEYVKEQQASIELGRIGSQDAARGTTAGTIQQPGNKQQPGNGAGTTAE